MKTYRIRYGWCGKEWSVRVSSTSNKKSDIINFLINKGVIGSPFHINKIETI